MFYAAIPQQQNQAFRFRFNTDGKNQSTEVGFFLLVFNV